MAGASAACRKRKREEPEVERSTKRRNTENEKQYGNWQKKKQHHNYVVCERIKLRLARAYQSVYFVRSWERTEPGRYPVLGAVRVVYPPEGSTAEIQYLDEDEPCPVGWEDGWEIKTLTKDFKDFATGDNHVEWLFVPKDDYIHCPQIRDKFSPTHLDAEKINANLSFVKHLPDYTSLIFNILYLDSEDAMTTAFLRAKGIPKERLHVPNPGKEFRQHLRKGAKHEANFYPSTVYEFVRDLDVDKPNERYMYHVWLDYCCTFNGNATTHPKIDIQLLFAKHLLALSDGVFGVTFSRRDSGNHEIRTITTWIQDVADRHGYRLVLQEKPVFYRMMVYMFFKTTK